MPSPREGTKLVKSPDPNFLNAVVAAATCHGVVGGSSFMPIAMWYFPNPLDPAWEKTSQDISEFLDRKAINQAIDTVRATPGRIADLMALKIQSRWMAAAERSLRLRYKPHALLFTDAQARSKVMADDDGPVLQVTKYVENVINSE